MLLRFIGDSDALRLWLAKVGPMAAADQLIVVILIALMLAMDVQLALVVLVPLTPASCRLSLIQDKTETGNKKLQKPASSFHRYSRRAPGSTASVQMVFLRQPKR